MLTAAFLCANGFYAARPIPRAARPRGFRSGGRFEVLRAIGALRLRHTPRIRKQTD
jgi:hypothetical protein